MTLLPRYHIVVFTLLLGLANGCLGTEYAGTEICAGCHQAQFEQWQGSHHDWAMTVASDETVLGNFNNASFSHHGVTSTFKRKDGGYYVNTQAASGEYQDFRIDYTFGVEPLQQYLIKFSGGRLQALEVLQVLLEQAPSNYDFLFAAITISRYLGHLPEARAFAKRLIAIFPQDQSANQLLLTL